MTTPAPSPTPAPTATPPAQPLDPNAPVTAFGEELSQSVLQADLDNLPDYVRRYLDGIDVDAMGKDAADKLLAIIDAVATQRATLEQQIYELTTSDAQKLIDTRAKEREAIDASNSTMLDRLYALQDERAATAAAAQAAQEKARIEEQIANQRSNLQTQLYQLTGNTAALRADVLATLGGDAQSIALQQQVRIVNGQPVPLTDEELAALQAERAAWAQRQAVPEVVTMRQARLALLGAGLLAQVDATIAALPSSQRSAVQIFWEYSTTVERNNATVLQLASALQLTSQQLDALFVQAAGL